MITRQMIEERMASLADERERLIAQVNVFNGGIEDCKWFLDNVDKQDSDEESDAKE
jgi:hypothetical protein